MDDKGRDDKAHDNTVKVGDISGNGPVNIAGGDIHVTQTIIHQALKPAETAGEENILPAMRRDFMVLIDGNYRRYTFAVPLDRQAVCNHLDRFCEAHHMGTKQASSDEMFTFFIEELILFKDGGNDKWVKMEIAKVRLSPVGNKTIVDYVIDPFKYGVGQWYSDNVHKFIGEFQQYFVELGLWEDSPEAVKLWQGIDTPKDDSR